MCASEQVLALACRVKSRKRLDRHELRTDTFWATRSEDFLKGVGQQMVDCKPTAIIGGSFRDGFREDLKERLCRQHMPRLRVVVRRVS